MVVPFDCRTAAAVPPHTHIHTHAHAGAQSHRASFGATFCAVICGPTVSFTLSSDVGFQGDFIIVLATIQTPLGSEAVLMSAETRMKLENPRRQVLGCTASHD